MSDEPTPRTDAAICTPSAGDGEPTITLGIHMAEAFDLVLALAAQRVANQRDYEVEVRQKKRHPDATPPKLDDMINATVAAMWERDPEYMKQNADIWPVFEEREPTTEPQQPASPG